MAKGNVAKATKKKTIKCNGNCGRELAEINFYNSNSPLFSNGKVNICKKCLNEKVDYDDIHSIYTLLQSMDIPFIYEYWDKAMQKNPASAFGNYVRMANSLSQFKGLRWRDSVFDSSVKNIENNNSKTIVEEDEEIIETVYSETWRGTYTLSDLAYLDKYYKDLDSDFKIVTRNHKDYARKIAKASLAMDRAYDDMINGVQGSDTRYKNLKDTFDSLSKSAQFAEEKRGANEVGLGAFGVVFEKVESKMWIPQHTPLEKDAIDELIEYFSTIERSL